MIGLLPHSLITEEEIASVKTLRDGTESSPTIRDS